MSSDQSFSSITPKKRKYDRQPDTEAMTRLRVEAAKSIKKKLGLSIDARSVRFNGKPFLRQKTIYVWRAHGELTDDERQLLNRTIECNHPRPRPPWKWSDRERAQLETLIQKEALIPEYYDRSSGALGVQSLAWEPSPSDSDTDLGDTEVDDHQENSIRQDGLKRKNSTSESGRPAKRRRKSLPNPDTGNSFVQKQVVPENSPQEIPTAVSTSRNPDNPTPPVKRLLLKLPMPRQAALPDYPDTDVNIPLITPKNSTPPRTMALNADGILELVPLSPIEIPSPHTRSTAVAPIAASPFTATMDALAFYVEQNNKDEDEDDESGKEIAKIALKDMTKCMQSFLDHATVGYFGMPRLRKEKRAMKKEYEEKERQLAEKLDILSAKEQRLEEQMKIIYARENILKGRISSLETDNTNHVVDKVALEQKYDSLQEEQKGLVKLRDSMQEQIKSLEQDLASSQAAEKHLRHNESRMKETYQNLQAEQEKLQKSTDLETKELKQQIRTLHKTQSDLQTRQKELSDDHKSKEMGFQERVLALESQVNTLTTERDSLQSQLSEKSAILQSVITMISNSSSSR